MSRLGNTMNNKEKWANDVLQSLDGIQQAEPNENLFAKIITKLPSQKAIKIIPLSRLRWVAALACVIVGLNLYVIDFNFKRTARDTSNANQEYRFITNYSVYDK